MRTEPRRFPRPGFLLPVFALAAWAGAARADYDLYARARYPGAGRVPGVDLYEVREAGAADPRAYGRRVVRWWPRRGVDVVEVEPGMPLRTWTLRPGLLEAPTEEEPGRRWPWTMSRRFEAHLVGFRGIGNTTSSKFRGDGGPIEPAVVLRLPDGRKRCFLRGTFCEADRRYVLDLYLKTMARIREGLEKVRYARNPTLDIRWPDNARPGEPGTMQVESEHFVWVSGSQAGSDGDPWVNEKAPEKARWYREGTVRGAEFWWTFNEYIGHLMPYWDRKEKFKYTITVAGTKRDGYEYIGGYAGGGYGGCLLKAAGGGPWAPGLWHEWGHGCLSNRLRLGGGEAQADMHQCLADPSMLKGNPHVRAPWRNLFNGGSGYGRTMFYNLTGDDPNWGYGWFTCLPYGVEEWSVLQAVARVGEQRGLFVNGIRGLGDMVGEYGARLATFDCELEDLFRRAYFAPARNWLQPVDPAEGLYRIPLEEAPEPFGVNIVRLVPEPGADRIVVDFLGLHDPDTWSDWRACLVAVGEDGRRRYSPLWNKGPMALERRPGDLSYWLTVAATPTALYTGEAMRLVYDGRFAYRYPWSVRLRGARPGTPRHCRADFDDAGLIAKVTDSVPAPHDTEAGKRFLEKLAAFKRYLDGAAARAAAFPPVLERIRQLKGRVEAEVARMVRGARHPNGGGWVQATAKVAPTAYVGPNATVLDEAQVLDEAVVEDYAVVAGRAVVSGHARVSGQAVVTGGARVGGYARTWKRLDGTAVATVVPRRGRAETLHRFGLFAHYAMDRPERTVLEDWYRFEGEAHDGYLYGGPAFVADGEHKGFRFDGRAQWAELSPRVADLGEMTVEVALKPEARGPWTLLDFGTSPANRLVLGTGHDGRPRLVATVGGAAALVLAAGAPIEPGRWVRLRVEMDGERARLWVDGRLAAEAATRLRPLDVFPPGGVKRNFLATARDGTGRFQGVIDFVTVYHTVHEAFDEVPPPTRDAPRRPTADFLAALEKTRGAAAVLNAKADALARKMLEPYERLFAECRAREQALLNRSPDYRRAVADLAAAEEALGRRRRELAEAFDALPEVARQRADLRRRRAELDALRRRAAGRAEGVAAESAARRALEKAEQEYRRLEKALRTRRDLYVAKGAAEATRKVAKAKKALQEEEATDKAWRPYEPERAWLFAFVKQGTGGYYNSPYRWYIARRAREIVGGGELRDDPGTVKTVLEAQTEPRHWHTAADWDWRMPQEVDGSIADLPIMRRWLERVRGPVVTQRPDGAAAR